MDIDVKGVFIPTYVINMKNRKDRLAHIKNQFLNKAEFDVKIIDACVDNIGAVGLWKSIVKIVTMADEAQDDVIIICEDDHEFTSHYNSEYLIGNIAEASIQGADILSGGIGGFGYAVPIARNRFWVDFFWCTQFIVVYRKFFSRILEVEFKETDTADGILSKMSDFKMTMYPFISIQRDFGYSDVTERNNKKNGVMEEYFRSSNARLNRISIVSNFFNYQADNAVGLNSLAIKKMLGVDS
ncbi:glycosyl transferase [Chitinophaga polysaccharea]|uniref:glycosyl transferase n=1 Tax=Chitinophaga polysaccharea TaxID=1293035 RepID=UPI001455D176|nr:glycosyl transferase [Chitinophaga polysaccharea]NLR56941.1 glycosyl transferase [Chitinophaga polysaccharea]